MNFPKRMLTLALVPAMIFEPLYAVIPAAELKASREAA